MEPAHALTNPAAGWFPDPHAPNLLRWWDGMQWTHHVHPQAPAAPATHAAAQPSHAQAAPAHVAAGGYAPGIAAANNIYAPSLGGGQPTVTQATALGGATMTPAAYGGATTSSAGLPTTAKSESLFESNPRSLTAIGISILYLVMAMTTGVVLIGIVPALFTFRAFEGREKLAPGAALAAAAAIGFAFTHVGHA